MMKEATEIEVRLLTLSSPRGWFELKEFRVCHPKICHLTQHHFELKVTSNSQLQEKLSGPPLPIREGG